MNDRKFTYDEMLERVPDYVFDKLEGDEKAIFEENLGLYPDIVKEIEDAKLVFTKFDKIDFDRLIDRKTRNLSVGVNSRLNRRAPQPVNMLRRYAVPTVAIVLLMVYFYTNSLKQPQTGNSAQSTESIINVTSKDALSLIDDKVNENDIIKANSNLADLSYSKYDYSNVIKLDESGLNDLILDEVFKQYSAKEMESVTKASSTNELMELVKDLDENDLQIILKGIEDAKIVS